MDAVREDQLRGSLLTRDRAAMWGRRNEFAYEWEGPELDVTDEQLEAARVFTKQWLLGRLAGWRRDSTWNRKVMRRAHAAVRHVACTPEIERAVASMCNRVRSNPEEDTAAVLCVLQTRRLKELALGW
jgi:hypothetical protein